MSCEKIDEATESDIRRWLEGAGSVFVTGATGFVGMVLLEKLLRGVPGLSRVYVLIRDKRQQSAEERLQQLLKDPLFQKVPASQFEKISIVKGDVSFPSLGLDEETWNSLQEDISVVFHVAATVKFDEHIRRAVNINVHGTSEVLRLCHGAPQLKAVVHVSTAYSNSNLRYIGECTYTMPCSAQTIITMVDGYDNDTLTRITPQLIGDWPNTYTYTKTIAEGLVAEAAATLPVVIVRPAIVTSTADEPIKGWTNNCNGLMGIILGYGVGIIRTLHIPPLEKGGECVPCDKVANLLLASAWDVARTRSMGSKEIKVFNYVSSTTNPFIWRHAYEAASKYGSYFMSTRALWIILLFRIQSRLCFTIMDFLLHTLPAIFIDIIFVVRGKKPRSFSSIISSTVLCKWERSDYFDRGSNASYIKNIERMLKIARKIQKHMKANSRFYLTQWTFVENNVPDLWARMSALDRKCFNFNLGDVDWNLYLLSLIIGVRLYIVKELTETDPAALIRMRRMYWANAAIFTFIWLLLLGVLGRLSATVMSFLSPAMILASCFLVFVIILCTTVTNSMFLWPPLLVNNFYDKKIYTSISM